MRLPPRSLASVLLSTSFALGLAGCGAAATANGPATGGVQMEPSPFPTREEVKKLAAVPAPAHLFDDQGKDVPTWDLSDPLPSALDSSPYADDSVWGKLLAEAQAAQPNVVATEAMHCIARENATFYLANNAFPAEALGRFIAARCGSPTPLVGSSARSFDVDDRVPEEKVVAKLRDKTKEALDKMLAGSGPTEAGVAYVRKNGHAGVALTVTKRRVRLDPTPLVPGPDGNVIIRGEVLVPAQAMRALINRGRYSYAVCKPTPGMPLPRFEFTCAPSPDDEAAWLSISAVPPGHLLGFPAVETLIWPSGKPGKTYANLARAPGEGSDAPPPAATPNEQLLQAINTIRKQAGLPMLRLEEGESATAAMVAPHYFASLSGSEADTTADKVALGLRAGWDVSGLVRHANMVSMAVSSGAGQAELLRAVLASPTGRETLLDPEAERLAVGVAFEKGAMGALFSTYALFDGYRHDNDWKVVAGRLAELRAEHGTPKPTLVTELSADADRAAKSVQNGLKAPGEALNEMLTAASTRLGGRGVRGWVAETSSLEQMRFPDQLLVSPAATLGVGVAHYRREGHPWGRFVVFVVTVDDSVSGGMTARSEGPSAG